ncbi:MAG: hypothetical protein JJD93_02995 [Ilumatobacteraceae bacterium]|nr:hypothetical protein [Ilumatobacteraceae bacterium]
MLPLLEAGVRHGVFGMTVAWAGVSVAIAGWISLSGNGADFRLEAPVKFIGLLLLVALPAAHLSEHLVERVEQYSRARTLADRRSELLAAVLDASGTLVSPDPSAVDAALIAGASQLFTGRAKIIADSPPQGPSDLIAHAIQVNGAAVSATDEAGHTTVAISLGGSHPRIVVCAADHHLDEFTVNALEILCAHARIALRTAALHVEARLAGC